MPEHTPSIPYGFELTQSTRHVQGSGIECDHVHTQDQYVGLHGVMVPTPPYYRIQLGVACIDKRDQDQRMIVAISIAFLAVIGLSRL